MAKIIHINEELLMDTIEDMIYSSDCIPVDCEIDHISDEPKKGPKWVAEAVIKAIRIMEAAQDERTNWN